MSVNAHFLFSEFLTFKAYDVHETNLWKMEGKLRLILY